MTFEYSIVDEDRDELSSIRKGSLDKFTQNISSTLQKNLQRATALDPRMHFSDSAQTIKIINEMISKVQSLLAKVASQGNFDERLLKKADGILDQLRKYCSHVVQQTIKLCTRQYKDLISAASKTSRLE
jgi:hypothetical protein